MLNVSDSERRSQMAHRVNANVWQGIYEQLQTAHTLNWNEAELKAIEELKKEIQPNKTYNLQH
jgi:hypothetical protein